MYNIVYIQYNTNTLHYKQEKIRRQTKDSPRLSPSIQGRQAFRHCDSRGTDMPLEITMPVNV